jgi:hypothetical protein
MELVMIQNPNDWRAVPEDVHLTIRSTIRFLRDMAGRISDAEYRLDRDGWAIDCDMVADNLDFVLGSYGLPSRDQLPCINAAESDAEALERELLKRR